MCRTIRLEDGTTVIVCSRGDHRPGKVPRCVCCRQPSAFLCDGPADPLMGCWPDEEGKGRCSAPLCPQHAYTDGAHHFCFAHRPKNSAVVHSEKVRLRR